MPFQLCKATLGKKKQAKRKQLPFCLTEASSLRLHKLQALPAAVAYLTSFGSLALVRLKAENKNSCPNLYYHKGAGQLIDLDLGICIFLGNQVE